MTVALLSLACSHLHKEDYVHPTVMVTQQYVAMVTSLKSHLESLSHDEALFETFWDHHKAILDHKIYLGDFLRSVEKVWPSHMIILLSKIAYPR